MTDEFNSSNPIYLQLAERINRKIVRREILAGEKLPSVREMAINSGVNPNTVQRTYSELERIGIVETRRGQGTYVTEKNEILTKLRDEIKENLIQSFINSMIEIGFTLEEIINEIDVYIKSKTEKGE